MTPYLASLIRHAGTAAGGYLIAKGHAEIGGLITAIFAGWGVQQKRTAGRKLADAITTAAANVAAGKRPNLP